MALSSCDKYLKKLAGHSNLLSAQKAFILVQLGKDQAGIDIANDICKRGPTETETLIQLEKVFIALNDCNFT